MYLPSIFLRLLNLNKQIPDGDSFINLFTNLNLTVNKGESIAIMGPSGSGKTTLLTLMGGLDLPTTGEIYLNEILFSSLNEEERTQLRGQMIGFIFQSFQLLPELTALQNVMLPLEIKSLPDKTCQEKAKDLLNKVGLSHRLQHYPASLSGGEQQRVAIARAFIHEPSLILADEMTGNLDQKTGEKMMELLFNLQKDHKTTLILVTHDEVLAQKCQKKFILHNETLEPC